MEEYLAFVEEVGQTLNGRFVYRFYFTSDTSNVWGEYFNVVPSAIIPNLQVDMTSITSVAKASFPQKLILAKKNYCFSMQDCIDGIIPLCFVEICDETLTINDIPFFLRFGETYEDVISKLETLSINLYDKEEHTVINEEIVDLKEKFNQNNDIDDLDF